MKKIKLDLHNKKSLNYAAKLAAKTVKNEGIIIYPTDTLYGIGANAINKSSILKVYKIKKRSRSKPIPIIVRDIKMAKEISYISFNKEKLLRKIWPGPITIILKKKDIIPNTLTSGEEKIALRISKNKFTSLLMNEIDFPLTSTSANVSEKDNLTKTKDIIDSFREERTMDLFIDSGDIKKSKPSTIVDLTGKTPKLLRDGAVDRIEIRKIFEIEI